MCIRDRGRRHGRVHAGIGIGNAVLDECDRGEDLERRAGRVAFRDRAVEHRVLRVGVQRRVRVLHLAGVTGGQCVRIEGRRRVLKLAKLSATHEEVVQACKKAAVHDFIMTLPQGYATPVGELGETLSGGERQRLGLARAFLHDAPFVLLDEPTSNLDSLNEAVILRSVLQARQGKTFVLVSHRESTMRIADIVYSAENGKMCIRDRGYQPHRGNHTAVTKTAYGATLFSPALSRTFALKYGENGYEPDMAGVVQAVLRYARARFPVRFMGFPSYTYFMLSQMRELSLIHI